MNLLENVKEGLRSVQANMLRSVITALIVAIGITALVGALTAVDGIEKSVTESLTSLGANSFDIESKSNRGQSQQGVLEKSYPRITMRQALTFVDEFTYPANVSLSATLTMIAEISRNSKKTNPNVAITGANPDYAIVKGLEFEEGRNMSELEYQYGSQVAILGNKIRKTLYDENEPVEGTEVTILGSRFRVIGALAEKGGFGDPSFNFDNMIIIPIKKANQMAKGRSLWYRITVAIPDATQVDIAMGEATALMRRIRGDQPGREDSFIVDNNITLLERTSQIAGYIRTAGFGLGFVTLLGSAIALMNIMLVSVTERTREIGVRKALGATPLRIRQQFVIEAIVVCLLGGLLGILLGILAGNAGAKFMGMKNYIIPWFWIFFGLFVCVVVGLLSGYYPAHKASKLDPIESLRFE
jgi:putative ABC transport system permease protein